MENPSPGPCADVNNMYRECRLQLPHLGQLQPETVSLQGEHTVPPSMLCLCCVCLSVSLNLPSPQPDLQAQPLSHCFRVVRLMRCCGREYLKELFKNCPFYRLSLVVFIDYHWSYIGGSAGCNLWKCYMDSMQKCRAITSRKGKKNICKECHVLSGVCLTVMTTLA